MFVIGRSYTFHCSNKTTLLLGIGKRPFNMLKDYLSYNKIISVEYWNVNYKKWLIAIISIPYRHYWRLSWIVPLYLPFCTNQSKIVSTHVFLTWLASFALRLYVGPISLIRNDFSGGTELISPLRGKILPTVLITPAWLHSEIKKQLYPFQPRS